MKKQITLLLLSLLMTGALSAQQTLLGYFSFPTRTQTPSTPTSFLADGGAQSGTAGLYLDGTHGSSTWVQNGELDMFTGSDLNLITGDTKSFDLALVSPSANEKSLVFHLSTTGYQNIVLSYATRSSNTTNAFNTHSWSYSTDGSVFTPIAGNTANFSTTYAVKSMDFTSATAINDQANVYLKLTISGLGSGAGSSVNNRIDNVQINAVPAGPDTYPPKITNTEVLSGSSIKLTFNEALNQTSATTASNYVINGGAGITAAALATNVVTLTVNPAMTEGDEYQLSVSGIKDLAGNEMDSTFTFMYGVPSSNFVANIAELKTKMTLDPDANTVGTTVYKLTGEVTVTATASHRNQKWIQDATGAVLVDDLSELITTTMEIGDNINNIYGTLTNYYGLLQFVPTQNVPVNSSFNPITALPVTMANLKDNDFMINHQSEVIKLANVTFTDANGTLKFDNGKKFRLNPGTTADSLVYTSIFNVINNVVIPSGPQDVSGINTFNRGKYYIVPRGSFDIVAAGSGIKNNTLENVSLYPNPADNYFVIENQTPVNVEIYNSLGILLLSTQYAEGTNYVNRENMAVGFYTVRIIDQQTGAVANMKLILR